MAKLVELIESSELRGKGTEESPLRHVTQWWTKDGALVVERDPLNDILNGCDCPAGRGNPCVLTREECEARARAKREAQR